jgi:hypothetical protein
MEVAHVTTVLGWLLLALATGLSRTATALSRELTVEEWTKRSPGAKYVDTAMRLTATLQ